MKALRLSEVAALLDGELVGSEDPEITGVAGLEDAGPGDLTFVGRQKLSKGLAASGATAVIAGSRLGAHVILGCDISVGRNCLLHSGVTVREGCQMGDRVIIHSGVVIGSDGFGYLTSREGIRKIPQVGVVEIQDDVEIGAGSCVDRATTGRTVVGAGSKIDNLVQIGHNVNIGKSCSLSAQTGIAGSSTLGEGVFTGGQVGIGDHIRIGAGVKAGGQTGITNDIPAGQTIFGYPALELTETFRMFAALRKLPELLRRVNRLEKDSGGSDENVGKDQD
jgi:UDP-3-O-[3-hydroxymyristoyl] glucosamine N-acyltransferase